MADVPNITNAEIRLLGAMLVSSAVVDVAHRLVTADEFYDVRHKATFAAIVNLWLAGESTDPVSVATSMGRLRDRLELADLQRYASESVPSERATRTFCKLIVETAALRNLQATGKRIMDKALEVDDPGALVDDAHQWITACYESVAVDVPAGPDLDTFLAEKAETDWLVPGFLERTDRVILTGEEGRGKSTALRQAGLQMAAGIVPFTSSMPCEPVKVLLVDCENPRGKLQRQLAPLRATAGESLDPSRFVALPVERGLDLANRADRRWLEERIAANRPDVVISGPIYKLHSGDPNEERPAARLRDFFDDLRTRFGFALMLEAHQPYASGGNKRALRPYGASLWSRWPDIGLCLLENREAKSWSLAEFRGFREDRPKWPASLTRHDRQMWPWLAAAREF